MCRPTRFPSVESKFRRSHFQRRESNQLITSTSQASFAWQGEGGRPGRRAGADHIDLPGFLRLVPGDVRPSKLLHGELNPGLRVGNRRPHCAGLEFADGRPKFGGRVGSPTTIASPAIGMDDRNVYRLTNPQSDIRGSGGVGPVRINPVTPVPIADRMRVSRPGRDGKEFNHPGYAVDSSRTLSTAATSRAVRSSVSGVTETESIPHSTRKRANSG
jgi:hypothetical protein